jgi:hypothetical protein
MTMISVDTNDLKAALSLLKAYADEEKAGAHFKDNHQQVRDGYYVVRVARLERALADRSTSEPKKRPRLKMLQPRIKTLDTRTAKPLRAPRKKK